MITKLSVNVNKIATLRNARGENMPNVVTVAQDCERFGADGITVHPRPDERHITRQDVVDLASVVKTEFNVEGYPDDRYMRLVGEVLPSQATLVPDAIDVLTSNAGWNTRKNQAFLTELAQELRQKGIRSSIFVDTDPSNIEYAAKCGVDRIELYTGPYAQHYQNNRLEAVSPFTQAAKLASELGLDLNAGHDLNLHNLKYFKQNVANLKEVSIGHALISDALYFGLENTVQMYKRLIQH